ncbi:topology modulation protein [Planococcus shenhongbingii]|uniref:Topology modulation protein n=1 Tax=Planococcus shenhongbingii TaxID=3058398 RepID=A0ABT8NG21_9BACL|nr:MULTISPECIES: topology modulation protein [unclassified Planococcus (in: firmicutes)]MDN7246664.1 topology modulation protein [Planococcus sp. N017]WKA58976.1 topology modulation protein [Planococcus sp. N016]
MKKIMVTGVSAGAGKSTFAAELGEKLGLPVHHLDSIYWKPGWIEAEPAEFRAAQEKVTAGESWIIEGNYSDSFDIRFAKADTFIYLELPLRVCLYRVLKRWLTNIGNTRPDMAEGCPEKMDLEFLKFIVTTYAARKVKMRERMRKFQEVRPENQIIFLGNKKQINGFLKSIAH